MDLAAQRHEVNVWLEEILGEGLVPEFELNTKTITQLYQIVLVTRCKDKTIQQVVDDLQQKTDEYNVEAERLSGILHRLNLTNNNLSQAGVSSLRTLAKLGVSLDIKDASDTCYLLAIQDLDNQLEQVRQERQIEAKHLEQLIAKHHQAILKCNALEKALDAIKQKVAQEKPVCEIRKEIAFCLGKIEEYQKDISNKEMKLAKTKVDKDVFHESLVKNSDKLKSLQDKLAPLKAELQTYSSLPPNLTESTIITEQLKEELARLEKEILESIEVSIL
ncbi:unnamed protein product [Lymnaea stagnalis]|uniref:HAUS augmin-like complex subunit 1 n=1 Tax=Lymnaea stagnalis TaxID=6523 RepID=A0AAV2H1X0_LYMST